MAGAQKKNLDSPDERLEFEGVAANVVQVADAAISRNVFQPGAHCALGGRRLVGNHRAEESCQAHHSGVVLEGRLHIEMDDGSVLDVGPNEVYDIPPGHDGWTTSEQPLLAINWSGVRSWLPEPESGDRVLATLLFTDIVGSTEPPCSSETRRGGSFSVATIGTSATSSTAIADARSPRPATVSLRSSTAPPGRCVPPWHPGWSAALGIEVRTGIHTGEVEVVGDDVRGVSCTRPPASPRPPERRNPLSATTCQLATGSGFTFEERGERELKGLDEPRLLFAVSD